MLVETAYPFSLENRDDANNILGEDALVSGYPATEDGQYEFVRDLSIELKKAGVIGLIYWEPAWVSTECSTLWGQGSHWENACLLNYDHQPTKALKLFSE